MLDARQQRRPALLFVCGSDRERLVVLLVPLQRESSICVRPLAQVSITHIKPAPARPRPLKLLNERVRKATNRVFYPAAVASHRSAVKTCCLSFSREDCGLERV